MTAQGHPRTRFARSIRARDSPCWGRARRARASPARRTLSDGLSVRGSRRTKYELAVRKYLDRWIVEERP